MLFRFKFWAIGVFGFALYAFGALALTPEEAATGFDTVFQKAIMEKNVDELMNLPVLAYQHIEEVWKTAPDENTTWKVLKDYWGENKIAHHDIKDYFILANSQKNQSNTYKDSSSLDSDPLLAAETNNQYTPIKNILLNNCRLIQIEKYSKYIEQSKAENKNALQEKFPDQEKRLEFYKSFATFDKTTNQLNPSIFASIPLFANKLLDQDEIIPNQEQTDRQTFFSQEQTWEKLMEFMQRQEPPEASLT